MVPSEYFLQSFLPTFELFPIFDQGGGQTEPLTYFLMEIFLCDVLFLIQKLQSELVLTGTRA